MTESKLEKKLKEYEDRISEFEKKKINLLQLQDNYQSHIRELQFKTLKIGTGIGALVGIATGVAVSAFDYLSRGYIGAEIYALSSAFVVGGSFAGMVAASLCHDLPFGAKDQTDMESYKDALKEVSSRLDYTNASLESYCGRREICLDGLHGLLRDGTDNRL